MTITLVGSSRELRHKRFLPPIDLLDLIAGVGPAADAPNALPPRKPMLDASSTRLPQYKAFDARIGDTAKNRGGSATNSPRSVASGDGLAEDLGHFLALLQSRVRGTTAPGGDSRKAVARTSAVGDTATTTYTPPVNGASAEVPSSGEERDDAVGDDRETSTSEMAAAPDAPRPSGAAEHMASDSPETHDFGPVDAETTNSGDDNVPCDVRINSAREAKQNSARGPDAEREACSSSIAPNPATGAGNAAPPTVIARPPVQPREKPFFARATAGSCDIWAKRKSRGRAREIPSSTSIEDPILRQCPALESRISDLRRDNTAAAQFLTKAQAAAWQRARRPPGVFVSRNRAVCALEGAQLSSLRREEWAVRAQRRRSANRKRRRCMEHQRSMIAEATRVKHEGLGLAILQMQEQAKLLERRQRFFIVVIVAANSAMRWRNEWKERKWKLVQFAEAIALIKEKESADSFERSVLRMQRSFRSRKARMLSDGHGAAGYNTAGRRLNRVRCLKQWVPRAVEGWKRRRREAALMVLDFLREAKLTQNIMAIYRFRRKVLRCQIYAKGFLTVTRARLKLLGLFYRRCEDRLRGRLAERMRQQVEAEAAIDLKVHRQMRPVEADRATRARRKGDDVSELMGTVAKLRLRSALDELEARRSHPAVRSRLLEGLLTKVRTAHQANKRLAHEPKRQVKASNRRRGEKVARGVARDQDRSASFAEEVFTVNDARNMLAVGGGHDDKREHQYQVMQRGSSTGGGGGCGAGEESSQSEGGGGLSTEKASTAVEPMLLLEAVSEATMCQLVLTGWEQSSEGGGSSSRTAGSDNNKF